MWVQQDLCHLCCTGTCAFSKSLSDMQPGSCSWVAPEALSKYSDPEILIQPACEEAGVGILLTVPTMHSQG